MNREDFLHAMGENCDEALQIVQTKNQDYADGEDPFQNFRMVEDAGLCSLEQGVAVRMSDKLQRIFNLLPRDAEAQVEDESLEDTLLDLMNYANILLTYRRLEQSKDQDEVVAEVTR